MAKLIPHKNDENMGHKNKAQLPNWKFHASKTSKQILPLQIAFIERSKTNLDNS